MRPANPRTPVLATLVITCGLLLPAASRAEEPGLYDLSPYYLQDSDLEAGYRAFKDGDEGAAREALTRFIEQHPDAEDLIPPVRYLLAEVEEADKAPEAAVAQLEAISSYAPLRSIVMMRLGDAWRGRGQRDRALDAYGLVRPDSPQHPLATLQTAELLREQGQLSDAQDAAETAIMDARDAALADRARLLLAAILAERGDKERARAELLTLFWGGGSKAKAAEAALKTLGAAPDRVDHLLRDVEAIPSRDLAATTKAMNRRLKSRFKGGKNLALRLYVQAELLRRDRSSLPKAVRRYEAAYAATKPSDRVRPYVLLGWALALRKLDLDLEAVARYTELADAFPAHRLTPKALLGAGDLLVYRGLPVEGEIPLRRLVKEHPDAPERVDALWELGWGAYLAGEHDTASQYFDLLARTFPMRRTDSGATWAERALYWRGRSEAKAGRTEQAVATLRMVVARYPLSYYSTQAFNRIRELAPETARTLRRRAPFEPERDPALLDLARYTVRRRAALESGVVLARLGLFEEAREELEARMERGALHADGVLLLASLSLRESNPWKAVTAVRRSILLATYPDVESFPLWQVAYPVPFIELADRFGAENDFSPYLLMALMRHESSFNPSVVSHANAVGLTQVLPRVARKVASSLLAVDAPSYAGLKDPETNMRIGARFLRELLSLFKGNPVLALAGYNAGPYAVKRWLGEIGHLQTDELLEAIPYQGTAAYTKKVLSSFAAYRYIYAKQGDPDARTVDIPQDLPDGYGPFMEPGGETAARSE